MRAGEGIGQKPVKKIIADVLGRVRPEFGELHADVGECGGDTPEAWAASPGSREVIANVFEAALTPRR